MSFAKGAKATPASLCALAAALDVSSHMRKLDTIMLWVGLMALLVGVLGFAIGFFGPIYFMPEANQGPLIGIFITGPWGAIAGSIIGAIIGYKKSKRQGANDI